MEDLIKKVSYLKGYADGLDINPKSDEGKLIVKLLGVLGEMADVIEELSDRVDDVEDVVDELDDCVLTIADDLYGDDEYEDYDDDDDEFMDNYDDDDDIDDNDYFEIQCPNCGEDVMIDFDMIDDDNAIVCPNCHEEIELEFECDCDDEDCGHDHE